MQPAEQGGATNKRKPRLIFARLESDIEDYETHTREVFADCSRREDARRRNLIAELRERVLRGAYTPNVDLIAKRMLADLHV